MKEMFGSPSQRLGMMQFNLNSISRKSIKPEPTTNQHKSIGWDTIVNLPSVVLKMAWSDSKAKVGWARGGAQLSLGFMICEDLDTKLGAIQLFHDHALAALSDTGILIYLSGYRKPKCLYLKTFSISSSIPVCRSVCLSFATGFKNSLTELMHVWVI